MSIADGPVEGRPLTAEELAGITARARAAWKGPWAVQDCPGAIFVEIGTPNGPIAQISLHLRADAEFIAHARQDVPALLADNARLRTAVATAHARVAELEALLACWCGQPWKGRAGSPHVAACPQRLLEVRAQQGGDRS